MKLQFKNLSGSLFEVDGITDSDTIAHIKRRVIDEHQYEEANLKLIFSGKILKDSDTVTQSGLTEGNFLVVMGKKAGSKPIPTAKPAEPKPVEQPVVHQPAPQPIVHQPTPQPVTQPTVAHQQPPATQTTGGVEGNTLLTGGAYNSAVEQLCEMGFPREDVVRALRAAFNNPERAVEYLMSGIPDNVGIGAGAPQQPQQQPRSPQATQPITQQQPRPAQPTAQPQQAPAAAAQQPGAGLAQILQQAQRQQQSSPLADVLRAFPQFAQIRAAIQQNPQLLQPILAQIGQQNPQLLALISQNPQEFLRLLSEPDLGGGAAPQAQPGVVFLTPQERDAVNNLVSLGFSREAAVQAYIACDKDENLAANFLFENGGEFSEIQGGGQALGQMDDEEEGDFEDMDQAESMLLQDVLQQAQQQRQNQPNQQNPQNQQNQQNPQNQQPKPDEQNPPKEEKKD